MRLNHFGGHHASGGFSVLEEKIHELPKRLHEAYDAAGNVEKPAEDVLVEREVDLAEVSFALKQLEKMAPFGVGNPKPLFIFPGVTVASGKVFGKAANHLELSFQKRKCARCGHRLFYDGRKFYEKSRDRKQSRHSGPHRKGLARRPEDKNHRYNLTA